MLFLAFLVKDDQKMKFLFLVNFLKLINWKNSYLFYLAIVRRRVKFQGIELEFHVIARSSFFDSHFVGSFDADIDHFLLEGFGVGIWFNNCKNLDLKKINRINFNPKIENLVTKRFSANDCEILEF